ncbi:hypothetical protein K439DRAFT_1620919 [Ramaria rubella]|nr:hypothetical protein K439DRAFT_1620919 [Ramaria rubella]
MDMVKAYLSPVKNVKAAIESILGVDVLPDKDHGELVAHFYKDPMKQCFALAMEEENWEEIKVEWAIHTAKRGKDAGIEVVLPKRILSFLSYFFMYFEHLDEAVKVNTVLASKTKVKSKAKDVCLFLMAKADTEMAYLEPDECDLNPKKTTEYHRKNELIEAWPCNEHPNAIFKIHALNGHHKVLNFEGELVWVLALLNRTKYVDLEHPPDIEYFKFF